MKSLTDYYKNYLESITYFSYTDLISDYISEIKEDLLIYSNDFFKELNYNKWINETYEDAVIDNSELTEDEFYNHKYTLIEKYGIVPYYKVWATELFETLSKSVIMTDDIINKIKKVSGVTDVKIINDKRYKVVIYFSNNFDFNLINHLMNLYGYSKDRQYDNYIIYEAVKPKALLNYKYKYLYHITTEDKIEKILKYGLISKRNNNTDNKENLIYPSRIYLFVEDTPEYLMRSFINLHNKIYNKNSKSVLLKIDIDKFNKDYNNELTLYVDPAFNCKEAIFCFEPILTKYITIEKEL